MIGVKAIDLADEIMAVPEERSMTLQSIAEAEQDGLRRFMAHVYVKLAGGLTLSALVAWATANAPAVRALFFAPTVAGPALTVAGLLLLLSPLAVLLIASFAMREPTSRSAAIIYWLVAALMGGSLSVLLLIYREATLTSTFLVTAGAFAGLSLVGLFIKRGLGGLGAFLTMTLIGLVLAMSVNLFLRNAMLELILNLVGIAVFAGLTAADTQRLRQIYDELQTPEAVGAASSFGALTLYLNFINLLQLLLSFSGRRGRP